MIATPILGLKRRERKQHDKMAGKDGNEADEVKVEPVSKGKRKFVGELLKGKFPLYRAAGSGMIFYPGMPQKLHGTKEAGRPDFDLSHFEDWPEWCQNLDTEHASIEVTADGYVIWWGGTVHDGIWCGDEKTLWMGGCFRDGIILGGHFWNCTVINGEKRGGQIHSGVWHGGVHRGGLFEGLWLGGTWMSGEFDGFRERTTEAPPMVTVNNWPRR